MEGRVEHRDVRDVGQGALCLPDRAQCRCVVQRRQHLQLLNLGPNIVVDHDRLAEPRAAVHDSVCDRRDVSRVLD